MGDSTSVKQLVGKIGHWSAAIPKANAATVKNAATAGKDILTAGAVGAGLKVGSPFPREKRDGSPASATWSARYTIKLSGQEPSAILSYRGPVHWVEGGTKPHVIGGRQVGRIGKRGPSKRQAKQASILFGFLAGEGGGGMNAAARGPMAMPGGIVRRGPFQHPGRAARPFWSATSKRAIAVTVKTAEATHSRALIESFR